MKELHTMRQIGMTISGLAIAYLALVLCLNVYLGNKNKAIWDAGLLACNFASMMLYFKKY